MGGAGSGQRPATKTIEFAKDRPIYERQDKESDKAWAAFLAFRDLGHERTAQKATAALNKPDGYVAVIKRWSQIYGWRQRIIEYDRTLDRDARTTKVEELAKAHREMVLVASSMWKLAAKDLMRWHKKIDEAADNTPQLSPRDVQALADTGMKLHRLMMGEPDAIQEHRHEVTVAEERKTLRSLLMDKEAMRAMDLIAEKLDGTGNGSGNGSSTDMH